MKNTDEILEQTGETIEYLKIYAKQQIDIVKLDTVAKSAKLGSSIITAFAISIVCMIVILFLTVAGALFLGQILGNHALGFLIVGVIFIIIGVLLFSFKKSLITSPLVSYFIAKVYEEE